MNKKACCLNLKRENMRREEKREERNNERREIKSSQPLIKRIKI